MSIPTDRIRAASRRPAPLGTTPGGAISLAMGEPFFPTPAPIVDRAILALRRGRTRYEALTGPPVLRETLAEHCPPTWAAISTPGRS
ncbi:hypothetical protein [Streptomyces sp. TS71-3]|uniref:hypothetical protein n=1 Tax=Streptomyces sp. TS71-3 TaxID=2733862 RepID=UPI001B06483A|nr:hypothetical protein [Streptomyces sp. TS71-3]GHJ42220.1 hypothetical protein Sm713_78290 [Streptomyces sp. TS71-3]